MKFPTRSSSTQTPLQLNNAGKHEPTAKPDLSVPPVKKLDYSGRATSKPLTCKTYETPKTTPIKNETAFEKADSIEGSKVLSERSAAPGKSEPPPLPPKPKYLAPKSSFWGQQNYLSRPPQEITNRAPTFVRPSDVKREARLVRNRRTIYLDQQSSSFV